MLRRFSRTLCTVLLVLATLGAADALAGTHVGDDVTAGVRTEAQHDADPFGYKVVWIDFDSPFRKTDLRIGDLVLGVDEVRYRSADFAQRSAVGDLAEAAFWSKRKARDGQPVTLTLRRDGREMKIVGALRANRSYTTSGGRPALQDGGPDRLGSDGFDGAWQMWYERFVADCSYVLDEGWERLSFENRKRLVEHLDRKPRVDHLAAHFPGPLADSVVADWTRVERSLRGKRIELTEQDLAWRDLGAQRVKHVAAAGVAAREALLAAVQADLVEPFPALDPAAGDRSAVVGKVVALPAVGMDRMISDLGRSFLVIGSRADGYWFADCNDPDMTLFFGAFYRYRGLVQPDIRESFALVGRIRDDPRMLTIREQAVSGLTLDVLGVMVNDQLFVDLRSLKGLAGARPARIDFAGEPGLGDSVPAPLDDASPPEAVMAAFITAVKRGDEKRWRGYIADWQLRERADGSVLFIPGRDEPQRNYARAWEQSRRLILSDVYDARVAGVSTVRTLAAGDAAAFVPRVEQVVVRLDHYGRFDGEYRSFVDVRVHRRYVLQRVGGGPWRIDSLQSL